MPENSNNTSGFTLVEVMFALAIAIIATSVMSYTLYASKSAGAYIAETQCRLSAQTALEQTKIEILNKFKAYDHAYPSTWYGLSWFNSYSEYIIGASGYNCSMMQ